MTIILQAIQNRTDLQPNVIHSHKSNSYKRSKVNNLTHLKSTQITSKVALFNTEINSNLTTSNEIYTVQITRTYSYTSLP